MGTEAGVLQTGAGCGDGAVERGNGWVCGESCPWRWELLKLAVRAVLCRQDLSSLPSLSIQRALSLATNSARRGFPARCFNIFPGRIWNEGFLMSQVSVQGPSYIP